MKVVGLLGGMSWESSAIYYQVINEQIKERLGGHNSAEILMYSVNFQQIKELQYQEEWEKATELMIQGAQKIEKGGAECLVICTNTMHKMAEEVQKNITIPLLHIADATAQKIQSDKIQSVGLLATKFTMEQDFYKGRLAAKYDLNVLVPVEEEREAIHQIIYDELCLGQIKSSSKLKYLEVIDNLIKNGAEAIILGCTEISLLIGQQDVSVPVYDTTEIHAITAANYSIL